MHWALSIGLLAGGLAALAGALSPRLRTDFSRPAFWLSLSAVAAVISGVSAIVANTRHSGTGFTTSHGWPKPFYFRYLGETGERIDGFSFLYFAGNALAVAGALLITWIVWRTARSSST